ncbi:MAG: phosphoglycerate dehydrogenase [Candidatus Pelagibacterales bacterium]|jgi:D-3-phosphoglycerate dehydrogenase|tara:strand:+ start:389 stop:2143 length:1755 start_codon:yes stop_codon:yes gene_type:complete
MNLKEFSKIIGINQSTVSRALNNYPDISDKTKESIQRLAIKHKYKPNSAASTIGSIKSSFKPKILIADKLSDKAITIFKQNKYDYDIKVGLKEDQLIKIIKAYDGVVVRSAAKITKNIIAASTRLKIIARAGVGVDNVAVSDATNKGIIVMNSPQSTSQTTAEHAIALLFSLARKIPFAHQSTIAKKWEKEKFKGIELYEKTIGLVGCGNIGSRVVAMAKGLGMQVLVFDPFLTEDRIDELGADKVTLDELLELSDFVTMHLPLNAKTRDIIDLKKIKQMKKTAYIINAARGGLINEKDLHTALSKNIIAGAALDVFETEPLVTSKFHELDNIILTPHLGASTSEAQDKASIAVATQIVEFFKNGSITNSVNIENVSGHEKSLLMPYLNLTEKLGGFAGQLTETAVKAISIELEGTAAMLNDKLLTQSVVKNLLGSFTDSINSINALEIAKKRGVQVTTTAKSEVSEYNSLIRVIVTTERQTRSIAGSLFGNKPRIVEVKGIKMDADLGSFNIYITNRDTVGVINKITDVFLKNKVNIASFNLGRIVEGGEAIAIIKIDNFVEDGVLEALRSVKDISQAKLIVF